MEFGMFHEFQCPPGASAAEAFAQSFEQVDAAERWGLDAMWLAELHFAPERSVLASPLILAAAIAQRTKRMKIGTAVQVLPLCHPLRLAEEVATIGGRVRGGAGCDDHPADGHRDEVRHGEGGEAGEHRLPAAAGPPGEVRRHGAGVGEPCHRDRHGRTNGHGR